MRWREGGSTYHRGHLLRILEEGLKQPMCELCGQGELWHGRPPYRQLLAEIEASSLLAVGRRYGVSDNAIRKWLRACEAEERRDAERV